MNAIRPGDDSGVNMLVEYIISLGMVVLLFMLLFQVVNNLSSTGDHIALQEEYKIIANDVANRISAFSDDIYLNSQLGLHHSSATGGQSTYFDLPEPVKGKQYVIEITYNPGSPGTGIVTVYSASDSTISWSAAFQSKKDVQQYTGLNVIYSASGRYKLNYDPTAFTPKITMENTI